MSILRKFEGGSTRSSMQGRYDLIPREAIDVLAKRLELGAERHGENNWKCGGEEFRKATINHLMGHVLAFIADGNAKDDNLGAILCNAAFLAHAEAKSPYKP